MCPSARNRTRSATEGGDRVMGDHHGRLVQLVHGLAQERQDLLARGRVEVAGRLVGKEHGRPRDERATDRHALLLAARQLRGPVRAPVGQPHLRDERVDPVVVRLRARELQRQGHVLLRRQHRQQVEELEDEADVAAAQFRQLAVVHGRDVLAVDLHGPRRRAVEAGEQVHERRLARARRPHDRRELPAGDVDGHAAQRVDGGLALTVLALEVSGGDDRRVARHAPFCAGRRSAVKARSRARQTGSPLEAGSP